MKRYQQRGFTLLELMITLMVVGIILGIGVPNFVDFMRNSRMVGAANDLLAAMHVARGAAVSQRTPVTVCGSANPSAALPVCGAGANNGWVVYVDANDTNGDGIPDGNGVIDAGEQILLAHDPLPNTLILQANGNFVSYAPSGFIRDVGGVPSATQFRICDSRGNLDIGGGNSAARAIIVSATGRPQILRTTADIAGVLGGC